MKTVEQIAEEMYKQYKIEHTDDRWTMPAWSLLPPHAKEFWYRKVTNNQP